MLVSAIRHRFSRQQSSITARMRNLREAPKLSARKSSDQRAWGCAACGIGVRVPRARLRPRRRFTDSVVGKTVPRTVFRSSSILPVEPIELLVVHDHALAFEQHADPAISFISSRISGLAIGLEPMAPSMARSGGRSRRTVLGSTPTSRQARRCEIS